LFAENKPRRIRQSASTCGCPLRLVPEAGVAHPARADWAALASKARRIKGGQIAAGPLPRRIARGLRTLSPRCAPPPPISRAPIPGGAG